MTKKVALLKGGWAPERDVSLNASKDIFLALKELGYDVVDIDVKKDIKSLVQDLEQANPDVVFNGLYGEGGEDGVVQGVLTMMGLPFTHSSLMSSSLAMNKYMTCKMMESYGIQCPKSILLKNPDRLKMDHPPMDYPFVIKPNSQGSSIGVYIIHTIDDYKKAVQDIKKQWNLGDLLVEEYIDGLELSAAVLKGEALGSIEIRPKKGFYDYTVKYTDGFADHIVPAPLPKQYHDKMMDAAVKAHRLLGCRGATRCDFRFDARRENPLYFLEINTQPGFTPLSIVPELAQKMKGMDFKDIVNTYIEDALS